MRCRWHSSDFERTAGKGNLKFRDTGKMAFSFFNRKNGQKVRMCLKPSQADMSREEKQDFFLNGPLKKSLLFPNLRFLFPKRQGYLQLSPVKYAEKALLNIKCGWKMEKKFAWTVFMNIK